MKIKTLSELTLIKTALSGEYSCYLVSAAESCVHKKHVSSIMNLYAAYCYLVEQGNYTAFKILNNSDSLNKHFQLLIGFIYSLDNIKLGRKFALCNVYKSLFHHIAKDKKLSLGNIKLSTTKISDDALYYLTQFQKLEIDKSKFDYLNGWQVTSKEGKSIEAHLDTLYVNFGEYFTNKVHTSLKNYASKQKASTLKSGLQLFKVLFEGISTVSGNEDGQTIESSLSRNNVQLFFHKVFKVLFVRSQAALNCPKSFHTRWRNIVRNYTKCFVETGVFDEPLKPFIVPDWREPKGSAPTFSIGGNVTKTEKTRWFANIPLKVKDEEAVSIIQQRVERDMAHIKHVCLLKFEELLEREDRNKAFLNTGLVKPLSSNSHNYHYHNAIGADNLSNTVATFYEYGIGAKQAYSKFLGFQSNAKQLNLELNLPTTSTLNVLLTLLVMEHPLITPAWLEKWELYDTHGNKVGYKQVGNQYIAVSYKSRKGATNAQQEIILNEFSRSVVEFLIQHTHMAREYLKEKGDVGWRKMVLTAIHSNASCPVNLNTSLHYANEFHDWLRDKSLLDKNSDVTLEDVQTISELHSLRSIRRHIGLKIYLETRSMDAVAEVLGHEKKDAKLLTSYLPKPLMDFFNARWVRQFQSAILLEAMKDSVYRFDAVNMSAEDIEEFLNNHGICSIPDNLGYVLERQRNGDEETSSAILFNSLTYTISTSLLQLLMAIRLIVESDNNESPFLDIVTHWYQSAVFILDTLRSGKHSADTDLMDMLNLASKNNLDTDLVKGALLC